MKGVNQHKKMAMGGDCYKKGGSVKPNFAGPKPSAPLPKTGINDSPIEKVKRANGVKGV